MSSLVSWLLQPCPAQNPHIDVHGRPLRRHSQLRSQPDLQLHVMRWISDSGVGSLSVGSGVRRPSFSLHPQSVRFKATPHHCLLGGTPGTSVDVQLLTLVAESPSRISHTLYVSQWSASKLVPLDVQVVVYFPSIDNTEERFTGRSYSIFGRLMVIEDLHRRTQCWLRLQFSEMAHVYLCDKLKK